MWTPPMCSHDRSKQWWRPQAACLRFHWCSYNFINCSITIPEQIRTEKCSDTCQHKIKCVLTFIKNDLTLVIILAQIFVRSSCDLYRSTPKVLGKCQMSDCYFMRCILTSTWHIHIYINNTDDMCESGALHFSL